MVDVHPGRPAQVTAAGTILVVLGAGTAGIGLVLLVVAYIYGDATGLPDWVDLAPAGSPGGLASLALVGLAGALFGGAQVVSAIAVLGGRPWARPLGMGVAGVGALLCVLGSIPRAEATGTTAIFLPLVAAYLYAAVALALSGSRFRAG
ncbi:MAG: hypothetical protein ACRDHD_02650 [Candidatus Limnocylindria bacterium]